MRLPQSIQIEVKASLVHFSTVETLLKQYCDESGDRLLGRKVFQEEEQVLFFVHLFDSSHIDKHMQVLQDSRNRQFITSFQITQGSVLRISSITLFEQIHDFPLCAGDVCIPSIEDAQSIFLSIQRPLLSAQQSAWLLLQQDFVWEYLF